MLQLQIGDEEQEGDGIPHHGEEVKTKSDLSELNSILNFVVLRAIATVSNG